MSTLWRVEDRLRLERLEPDGTGTSFAEDVRQGLSAQPKFLSPKYFYDELGSRLFEAICALPEYYVARAEAEILSAHAGEIAAAFEGPVRLIELGSGDSKKTQSLIRAFLGRQEDLHYLPIDISPSAIQRSSGELLELFPELRITAFEGDYRQGLQAIAASERPRREKTLAIFLGSTLGNLDPDDQLSLLRQVRTLLAPGDGFLLGVDRRKPVEILLPAYDDPLGVTAAFNLNLLVRINRELQGEFDIRKFRHLVRYDTARNRIEMHLVSPASQTVRIAGLDRTFDFAAGESIFTESSYKFDAQQLRLLATESGFIPAKAWSDSGRQFSASLLMAGQEEL